MRPTRRELLAMAGTAISGTAFAAVEPNPTGMGVVIHSYGIRQFENPLAFLEHCRSLGAGGAQTALRAPGDRDCDSIRTFVATHHLYLEGSISLPRDRDDLPRFRAEVNAAKRCGVAVFRTVLMTGRRYEVFDSAESFRKFREQAERSLALALPVVEQHEIRMAVENHKDLQAPDLVDLIRRQDSPWVGICLDTGNNLALLEDPARTVELLAPLAITSHVKDMGVAEDKDGFLLAEVPLGQGFLDLPGIIAGLRRSRPEIRLNLEMITRDPLKIPCLTPKYWATLENIPGRELARALAFVRSQAGAPALPTISALPRDERLRREEEHVRRSLKHAREQLHV